MIDTNLTLNRKYYQHRSGDRIHNFVTPSVSDRKNLLSLSQPLSLNTYENMVPTVALPSFLFPNVLIEIKILVC